MHSSRSPSAGLVIYASVGWRSGAPGWKRWRRSGKRGGSGAALSRAPTDSSARRWCASCCAAGLDVTALVGADLGTENLAGFPVKTRELDLLDPASVRRGLAGSDAVVHSAACYAFWLPDPRDIYRVNVEGTRNVLAAARELGCRKVVYTSSTATLSPGFRAELLPRGPRERGERARPAALPRPLQDVEGDGRGRSAARGGARPADRDRAPHHRARPRRPPADADRHHRRALPERPHEGLHQLDAEPGRRERRGRRSRARAREGPPRRALRAGRREPPDERARRSCSPRSPACRRPGSRSRIRCCTRWAASTSGSPIT